jgi:uncharacterized glyoxalase superfamily metalloenzyme YdcJ
MCLTRQFEKTDSWDQIYRKKVATLRLVDGDDMSKLAIFGAVVGLVAVGLVILSSWQIPAPMTTVNKVIPNDKLPR